MAGRGRGRGGRGGATRTFNREQLSQMGITSNETLPGPVTQPPPLYPLMDRKPVPLTQSPEMDYLLILRQDFIDRMQISGSYLKMPESKSNQAEQTIDKLVAQLPRVKEKFVWKLFPSELRPKAMAKRVRKKVQEDVNVEKRLEVLEKIEEKSDDVEEKPKNDDEDDEMEQIDEIEEDEEMDEGTDYANNYFDNGENYEDEDDALEDGPIY
ncbi:unnamed protein product [Acanthoscelides obtectus]|uniref:DNA-directed RNA polymerase III subunit n=1 Tax=Acanthoscelides obtectus TaxID=200917 RepID=A0A9P0KK70_ACAOB|nr:unnamed protein product [Acanthoscelides obtectus]CAK1667687.1 DNA-directed RNA polymerase III subunit RPC7 [Acanthoscelides obtectus]